MTTKILNKQSFCISIRHFNQLKKTSVKILVIAYLMATLASEVLNTKRYPKYLNSSSVKPSFKPNLKAFNSSR